MDRLTDTEREAVKIAMRAVERVVIPNRHDVEVHKGAKGTIVVIWPVRYVEPTPGPDYYARVVVNPESGEVVQFLLGS